MASALIAFAAATIIYCWKPNNIGRLGVAKGQAAVKARNSFDSHPSTKMVLNAKKTCRYNGCDDQKGSGW